MVKSSKNIHLKELEKMREYSKKRPNIEFIQKEIGKSFVPISYIVVQRLIDYIKYLEEENKILLDKQ